MDFSDCIQFATENPVTYIATFENDQPRVRAFTMWFADKTGFYYYTGTPKSVHQLKKSPKVELYFYAPGDAAGKMMRVTGKVEFLQDKTLEERLHRDRPWMKELMKNAPKEARLAMFRVAHGEAWFWTMETNLREAEAPRVKF
jgi:uncharacterized pyridoxamine 5'-phosphate oxidase family protein